MQWRSNRMQRQEATSPGEGNALLDQPRLSDPRVAHLRHDPSDVVCSRIERDSKSAHIGVSPHQRHQLRRHDP
ncbi:MAG TPA: hypothetical protein VFI46_11220 [Jiangellaceae bacterium]|nr:hypothetical protein [Jiangellaceae bacterium]